eukprot:784089-Amphidinium_carterae.1
MDLLHYVDQLPELRVADSSQKRTKGYAYQYLLPHKLVRIGWQSALDFSMSEDMRCSAISLHHNYICIKT